MSIKTHKNQTILTQDLIIISIITVYPDINAIFINNSTIMFLLRLGYNVVKKLLP